jgi:hypothetical protein
LKLLIYIIFSNNYPLYISANPSILTIIPF